MGVPEVLAGRYEVRGLLGRGGMGEVYDGWDRRLERAVAIKVLNSSLAEHPDIRTRFELEARSAAVLVNPKVVAVYDTGEQDGLPYIVMERLPGRTLADEISDGPLAEGRVRSILLDMLQALAVAHAAGIVHRDIKPSNVLLAANGTAKIADFGIAKSTDRGLTQTGALVGTAAYLSPERVMGGEATAASDVYSVGIVGFEALTGRPPFEADTPIALVRAIMDDPMPSILQAAPGVDEVLAAAIDRATSRNPEDRFPSAKAMAEALAPASAAALDLPSPTLTIPQPLIERSDRSRNLVIAAGAAAVLLAILLLARLNSDETPDAVPPPPAASPSPSPAESSPASDRVDLSGVKTVEFRGPGTLEVKIGDGSLTIVVPPGLQQYAVRQVSGDTLTLGTPPGSAPAGVDRIVYRLGLPHLNRLNANGSGKITVDGLAENSLAVEGNGSGDTTVSGSAKTLDLSLSGAGNFDGTGLAVDDATVELSGSGDAQLLVAKKLKATLSGSGNLEYTGDAKVIQRADGSGRVRRLTESAEQDG